MKINLNKSKIMHKGFIIVCVLIIAVVLINGKLALQVTKTDFKPSQSNSIQNNMVTTSPIPTPELTSTSTTKPKIKPTTPAGVSTPSSTTFFNPTPVSTMPSSNTINVYITYYGWGDNDPPGTAIAYPKSENQSTIHQNAGGLGTYNDPITFASAPGLYAPGTKLYVPYIKKYVIMEDSCATCTKDWNNGKRHIDIWMGGTGTNNNKLITCEENWTRESAAIEVNPPNNKSVDTTALFNSNDGSCLPQN